MSKKQRRKHKVYINYEKGRDRWRVITISAAGKRASAYFKNEREARGVAEAARNSSEFAPSVEDIISKFAAYQEDNGLRPVTVATAAVRLRTFFKDELEEEAYVIDEATAQRIYDRYRKTKTRMGKPPCVATHHNVLAQAVRMYGWMMKRKLVDHNPFANIERVGRKNKGKPQLRPAEAARLWVTCLERANEGDLGALATALALGLGLRAGEIAGLQPRDIDGLTLFIERSGPDATMTKTEAGKRKLALPKELAKLVHKHVNANQTYIFKSRHWVHHHTTRLCKLAGVSRVPPHGLRGTCASIGAEAGQLGLAVANALGQKSFDVTRNHYLAPGTEERASATKALAFLESAEQNLSANFSANQNQTNENPEEETR